MNNQGDFGTDANTRRNKDYCKRCYANGKFTNDVSLDEFIEEQAKQASSMGKSENEVRWEAYDTFRKLKRWKSDQ